MKRVLELGFAAAEGVFWATLGNILKSVLSVILIWYMLTSLSHQAIPFTYALITCVVIAFADAIYEMVKLFIFKK